MKLQVRRYAWSFGIALSLTVLVGVIASVPRCSAVGVLLAPGMLAAAIVFPEGINSNWWKMYLVLAVLMNAFLLAWAVLWFWTSMKRFRWRGRKTLCNHCLRLVLAACPVYAASG
jgi:hypothetical protein